MRFSSLIKGKFNKNLEKIFSLSSSMSELIRGIKLPMLKSSISVRTDKIKNKIYTFLEITLPHKKYTFFIKLILKIFFQNLYSYDL